MRPIVDSATVIAGINARIGVRNGDLVHEKNWWCPSGKAVWMQKQMLRLLDDAEDSPHPGRKQANALTHQKCARRPIRCLS